MTLHLAAENGPHSLGAIVGAAVATEKSGYTDEGYVTPFNGAFVGVTVTAQSAMVRKVRLFIRYAADADQTNKVMVNYTTYDDPKTPEPGRFEKLLYFPATGSAWAQKDAGLVDLQPGDNTIRVYRSTSSGTGGICLDHFRLEPAE